MNLAKTIRILHVVGGMNRGGIETWLMHVLRHIDRSCFAIDFLVNTAEPCAYDDEITSLGSKIIPCPHPGRPWSYARNFRRLLREHGPYDVVHSHVHHYSGFVLRLAGQGGVPMRITHSHLDYSGDEETGLFRRFYLALMKRWTERHATLGLAASRQAAAALFGPDWQKNKARRLLNYGIDLSPFRAAVSRSDVRAELGIPADAFVVGHVGRFHEQKNHAFLVDLFAEIVQRVPNAHLLLVGVGDLRPAVEKQVEHLHLAGRVTFAGARSDVPRLMLGAMDAFVFPSHYEGLGIAAIEAQAAGIPCYLSEIIPEEADVVPLLVQRISLAESASVWADAIRTAKQMRSAVRRDEARAIVEASSFNIRTNVRLLEAIYEHREDASPAETAHIAEEQPV